MIGEVILKNKLFSGESINIEYKVEMPKKSEKYMKTVVAFANGRGGRIVFGVDDKTLNIVGMNPDTIFQTMDSITNAISDSCEPKIYPDVTLQSIDDKTIKVMVEGYLFEDDIYVGRSYMDAPKVDGCVFINSPEELMTGDFVYVKITQGREYDVIGEVDYEFTK